jgi:hypothetical protein
MMVARIRPATPRNTGEISILWTIGIILILAGAVLSILGATGTRHRRPENLGIERSTSRFSIEWTLAPPCRSVMNPLERRSTQIGCTALSVMLGVCQTDAGIAPSWRRIPHSS